MFDMNAILRADAATRADVHQKAIRGGWETPNEARRLRTGIKTRTEQIIEYQETLTTLRIFG